MAPGKFAEVQTAKHEKDRNASKKFYKDNAFEIQKRKLYAAILSGKRENLTRATIEKYDIQFNEDGEIIVPAKYKPKVEIKVEAQEPTRLVVKGRDVVIEEPRNIPRGAVTTHDVQTYIKTQYNADLEKEGKKQLGASSITQYSTGAGIFLKLGFVKDYASDIMPSVRDTKKTLATINSRQVSQATKNKDLHSVYFMAKNVPMIRDQVGKDVAQAYGKELGTGKKENTNKKYDELQAKKVYIWTDIVNNVEKRFGKNSIESLYFKVFEEVPIRGELANIPIIYENEDEIPKAGNYVLMKGSDSIEVHLKKYKTHFSYGDQVYTLSKTLSKMIVASLKKDTRDVLFEVKPGINVWLKNILAESGYPNFPYGKDTTQADRDKITSGIRHTFASYANSAFNKKFQKGHKLAALMLHELQQSLTAYQNKEFYTEADRIAHMNHEEGQGSGTRKGGRRTGARTVTKKDKGKKVA